MTHRALRVVAFFALTAVVPAATIDPAARERADAIFSATGVSNGLIVHLGCGDGQLTAALSRNGANVVHGLAPDPAQAARARQTIRGLDLYGPVAVACCNSAPLPYIDHLVNLLVVEDAGAVPEAEMLRVLVPGGVAYVRRDGAWTKMVKPPRSGVDEWTHYMYDASGNAVARDTVLGPPGSLQWTAGPSHTRSHEYTPSISALVSSGGRLFYILDQGPVGNLQAAPDWHVVARDAHNGVVLWRRRIGEWFSHMCGWTSGPKQLPRRLVAAGDRVYVTLGYHAPVSALDAATGEVIRTYTGTEGADEIIWHEGVLAVVVRKVTPERLAQYKEWTDLAKRRGSPLHDRDTAKPLASKRRQTENRAPTSLTVFEADSGKKLWGLTGADTAGLRPLSLRACGDRLYLNKDGGLFSFALRSGKPLWSKQSDPPRAVREDAIVRWGKTAVILMSPEDGSVRWTQKPLLANVRDVFIVGDSVWIGGFKPFDTGRKHTGSAWGPYFAVQRDLATGKVLREVAPENPGHHQRCYSSKATERYILGGRRGTEFIDLASGELRWNSWARGICRYGVMPANGLLYVPPHSCGCYITAKLTGFNALAAAAARAVFPPAVSARLDKGPAYARSAPPVPYSEDWPTYRGDAARSARARCAVSAELTAKWQVTVGGSVTAPTTAAGKVFLARPERHQLLALDAASGKREWTFTGGGRIDSPPTIHNGRALVGCRDGVVYSLQAADGAMAWSFRAARDARHLPAHGQLESVWPVHGSVLVQDGVAAFTAGRSSYLDGGIDLFRIDPATGKTLSRTGIHSPDPETGLQPPQYNANGMPGTRSDILVADDKHMYVRHLVFSKEGVEQDLQVPHLFTLTDFLDASWTHRSYWVFAEKSSISTGCSGRDRKLIFGRQLIVDDTTIYGYGRKNVHWSNEFLDGPYRLYARKRTAVEPAWEAKVPIQIHAMVLAGDVIFAAGPGVETVGKTEVAAGRQGALLLAVSAADGAELARYPLTAPPVSDGIAAARGELFLTLVDGSVLCMTGK